MSKLQQKKRIPLYHVFEVEGTFDVCVTNPPWGLLKPLKLFNSRCSEEELETYKASIAGYDDYMRQEYLVSQPTSKFGRWGTNLGRCGLEVALRLISPTGVVDLFLRHHCLMIRCQFRSESGYLKSTI